MYVCLKYYLFFREGFFSLLSSLIYLCKLIEKEKEGKTESKLASMYVLNFAMELNYN